MTVISLLKTGKRGDVGDGNKTRALDGHKEDKMHKIHKSDVLEPKGDRQEMSSRSLGISWPSWHSNLQGSGMSRSHPQSGPQQRLQIT
jgi:hypothetical protein